MQILLITLCVAAFLCILVLNVYFRVKVLRNYRTLVQNRVYFNTSHFFNRQKLEEEVLSKNQQHRDTILAFVNNIRFSVMCAVVLVVVIAVLAGALMFF